MQSISDDDLLRRLSELLNQSRRVESNLVAHIGEVDARRLYAREASSCMFTYCTEVLHLSEAEAYLRIAAARASRKYPMLLTMLSDGRIHLSGIGKLAPHLTEANCEEVLARAAHKSKREIEELVAELAPKPDVPATVRKVPAHAETAPAAQLRPDAVKNETPPDTVPLVQPSPPAPPPRTPPPPVVQPLAPSRYRVTFTASAEFRDKLERLTALVRPSVPDGDLAAVLEAAVTEKLERLEAKRFAETREPRRVSRRPIRQLRLGTFLRRSGASCASGTVIDARSWTTKGDAARSAANSSSITGAHTVVGATTARRIFA